MSDTFVLSGGYTIAPGTGVPSFGPNVATPIDESLSLKAKLIDDVLLDTDAPKVVAFGGVVNAHVVALKADGGPVVASVTSAAGASAPIPFDSFIVLACQGNPITALSLTRTPGTTTTVKVLLGEKA